MKTRGGDEWLVQKKWRENGEKDINCSLWGDGGRLKDGDTESEIEQEKKNNKRVTENGSEESDRSASNLHLSQDLNEDK